MFKKGNIVRFKCGISGDIKSPETGKLGVIEYSYGERYGNGEISGGYSVLDKETGASSAWWHDNYLEFVADGSEEEIKKCKRIAEEIRQKSKNIDYIKEKMLSDSMSLNGTSMLTLFHEIGYTSPFERNGEYFCLYEDWIALSPVFIALFNKQYDKMIECLNVFTEEYREIYKKNTIDFYNRVNLKS